MYAATGGQGMKWGGGTGHHCHPAGDAMTGSDDIYFETMPRLNESE